MPLVEPPSIEEATSFRVRVPVHPGEKRREKGQTKRLPPHAVVLHNDDINRLEWVVGVVRKVIASNDFEAFSLVMRVHKSGRGVVWKGSLEVAELKAEQLRACGPDPHRVERGAMPLKVTVEKLPE